MKVPVTHQTLILRIRRALQARGRDLRLTRGGERQRLLALFHYRWQARGRAPRRYRKAGARAQTIAALGNLHAINGKPIDRPGRRGAAGSGKIATGIATGPFEPRQDLRCRYDLAIPRNLNEISLNEPVPAY